MSTDRDYAKLLNKVSQNVKQARLARDLTQEDMVQFGFNYRHYQKLESGKYSLNLHTLHRLAKALKTEVRDFFK